jgi:uncharacterized membrane protein
MAGSLAGGIVQAKPSAFANPRQGAYIVASMTADASTPSGQQETSGGTEPARFDAILTPHRSLSPLGFTILMTVVAGVNVVGGIAFMLHGAWPVFGFCGLDVLLFYVMFRLNYRSARMFERIRLTADELIVERHEVNGKIQSWSFQPYWLRITMADPPEADSPLVLKSHGRSLAVGSFLSAAERLDLARALERALAAQRDTAAI